MRDRDRTRGALTRRGVLALTGTVAVAGCGALDGVAGDGDDAISGYRLPDVEERTDVEPAVQPSVPVEIGSSHLAAARERTTSLLATLPTPLGPGEIPNGHVRRELTDAADEATDGLDRALSAGTRFSALRSLRRAREQARFAAAGWAFVADGRSADALRRERRQAVSDARAFRRNRAYRGADPVRATLVHARVEEALSSATVEPRLDRPHEGDGLLTVAAWGEAAESVRALVADARHLDAQFAASLPDDAGTVESTLAGAAGDLYGSLRSRRQDLPPEPTADEWGPAEEVVDDLRRRPATGPKRIADTPGPASAVVDATEQVAYARAAEWAGARLDDGETFRIESAADLRTLRTGAYDELRPAIEESPAPDLARTVVTDAAARLAAADHELSYVEGDVAARRLDDVVAGYVVASALARATPGACRRTVDALRTA